MKTILLNIILLFIYSITSGQQCSGPLNITLEGSPTGEALTLNPIHSNLFCEGSDQGSIELNISGGTPTYSCIWNNGAVSQAQYNLQAGTYSVTVTDSNNCTKAASIHIIQQHPLNQHLLLADCDCCGYCELRDNGVTFIYQGFDYIIHVKDVQDNQDVGEIEACIEIKETEEDFIGHKLLRRHWEVNTSEAQSIVRLYFSNEEIESLIKESNYSELNEDFISNLSVIKFIGKKNENLSYETIEISAIKSLHQFGNTDVMYVEIPHHGVQNKRIGYALSIKPLRIINLETQVPEAINELEMANYSLKTNPVEYEIEILGSNPDETINGKSYIVDQTGEEMYSELLLDQALHRKRINVSNLSPGVYFYVIWSFHTSEKRVMKFIKI